MKQNTDRRASLASRDVARAHEEKRWVGNFEKELGRLRRRASRLDRHAAKGALREVMKNN